MKNRRESGMITIEVSVIVPLITMIMAVVLVFLLFLLDMAVAKEEAQRSALEVAAAWKNQGELSAGLYEIEKLNDRPLSYKLTAGPAALPAEGKRRLIRRINQRTAFVRCSKANIRVRLSGVTVTVTLKTAIPFPSGRALAGTGGWKYVCKARAPLEDGEEALRRAACKKGG